MSLALNQNLYARESKEIRQGSPLGICSLPSLSCANSLIYADVLRDFAEHAVESCSLYLPYRKGNFGSRKVEI